ncbi:MAG: acetylglutamate kinase [Myxococcales bacterium]|nr:acetylglutamate kinase [Myxococcales bacterium]MCB9643458.1 acetylglutamate kinase [Myxococcales bacterium]
MEAHLDQLKQALPYIRRFRDKIFVVKLSGRVTEDPTAWEALAEDIALCHQVGIRVVIVHGGGKQMEQLAKEMGVPQQVVNGRRITDDATLRLAMMTFAGLINTQILATLQSLGVDAVGLSGVDAGIVLARRRPVQRLVDRDTGEEREVDFGHVGDVERVQTGLLETLLDKHYVPVIASLGGSTKGEIFNINADTIAAEIAVALQAEKLILLSNTDGIYRDLQDPTSRFSHLSFAEAGALYEAQGIGAGMLPKLKAILSLLQRGVRSAHIINGLRPQALLQEVFTDHGSGTMIYREADE